MEAHVGAALNLIIPSGNHELKEKEELVEAFVKIVEAKGRGHGLSDEDIEKLRGHLCDAADKRLKADQEF